ncbi:hypothetical protein SAMN02982917_0025 [Azospirillum oryzae]|uniref:Uncharacterized protein n=1 Tax=Azospirillum oryzae TaxID=286727 RepID=A0A1X7HQX1_9PROT|nr:hypothetical protein [Azospirillum oryzae]SMF90878.1 hypothetical protein SAMN02982917_0025 [Azospirillum oryzae]
MTTQHEGRYPAPPENYLPALEGVDNLWRRGVKVPVTMLCDLDRLDPDEAIAGGRDFLNDPNGLEPGTNRSRSYWHGWRVARMNRDPDGPDGIDIAHRELTRRIYWWLNRSYSDSRVAREPHRYADLERAYRNGEAV